MASDFPAIRSLIRLVRINPTSLDWRRFIVAISPQGEIVGCGQIKPHRDGTHELASIAVMPGWRNRGVARALVQRLLESHPGPLYLTCRSHLGVFYEKFGFRTLENQDMTRYYRRISRLVGILSRLGLVGEGLRIMKRG